MSMKPEAIESLLMTLPSGHPLRESLIAELEKPEVQEAREAARQALIIAKAQAGNGSTVQRIEALEIRIAALEGE